MKKYDHKEREWVTEEEYDRRMSKRDTSLCRGKKPHDFVLVLPSYVGYDETYKFNPEEYYKILDEGRDFEKKQKERMAELGIKPRYFSWNHYERRMFMCTICKKVKYKDAKLLDK